MNILFLDFDGVVSSTKYPGKNIIFNGTELKDTKHDSYLIENINVFTEIYNNVSLVISSSWRLSFSLCDIRVLGSAMGLKATIIDMMTTDLPAISLEDHRAHEIERWIFTNSSKVDHFIIIDGSSSAGVLHPNQFVKVDPTIGFDSIALERAILIMGKQWLIK